MSHRLFRVSRVLLPVLALAACRSYRPAPLDPSAILRELRGVRLVSTTEAKGSTGFDPRDGLTLREAAAVGVAGNPELTRLRAERGIAKAQLIEAGLLEDPVAGWEASDWLVDGNRDAALTGLGLSWELPRPGERGAKRDGAQARIEEVRHEVLAAEWGVAREVALAYVEALGARRRVALSERLLAITRRTHAYFLEGRKQGAATALQENLAGLALAEVEAEAKAFAAAQVQARLELNELLGLPPDLRFVLQESEEDLAVVSARSDAGKLVEEAVRTRPDLRALLARYARAEAALKLEYRRQWPRISIGAGIEIAIPIFTRFNGPAIRTRLEERRKLALEVKASIHDLRGEVHAALARLDRSREQLAYFRESIRPRLEENLRLTAESLAVREITPLELLAAQRQVLELQSRQLDALIQHAKDRQIVATVSGSWLGAAPR